MCGLEDVFRYKHNNKGTYVEYRQWKYVWGLMIDSQKEVNRIIDEWNDNGYTCIGYQRSFLPNVSIFKLFLILIITTLTLGFVNFYVGPTMLFVLSEPSKRRYWKCGKCGTLNNDLLTPCKECGKKSRELAYEKKNYWKCGKCGNLNDLYLKSCKKCGEEISDTISDERYWKCGECGNLNNGNLASLVSCEKCGNKIVETAEEDG